MTEPDDDALRARLARLDPMTGSTAPAVPLRRRARPAPALVAAAVVAAVLVGSVAAAVTTGGGERSAPDVLAVETPTQAPGATPTADVLTPSPSPPVSPTTSPRPPSPRPPDPPASPVAPRTTPTSPASPSPTQPARSLTAEEMLRVEVSVRPGRAAMGNQLRVDVVVTNTSEQTLALPRVDSCGNAFGDVAAPGSGIDFDSGGDGCVGFGGLQLSPGERREQSAWSRIRDTAAAGTFDIVALARFTTGGRAYEVTGSTPVTLLDQTEGTRTFTLVNDTAEALTVTCPGCWPGGMLGYPKVQPGGRLSVTSSVFSDVEPSPGQVTLTPFRTSSVEGYALMTCLEISGLAKGDQGTVVLASSADPCPVRARS